MNKPGKAKKPKPMTFAHQVAYVFYVFLVAVFLVNLLFPSFDIPILSINFYEGLSQQPYSWTVTVPPSPEVASQFFSPQSNYTAILNVTISAIQPFAENVPITISVVGCARNSTTVDFTQYVVGFLGAYDNKHPGTIYNGEYILAFNFIAPKPPATWPNHCTTTMGLGAYPVHFIGDTKDATFYFRNPGTYAMSVQVQNMTKFTPQGIPIGQFNYPNNQIDIPSSAILNQNIQLTAVGIATGDAFIFAIIERRDKLRTLFHD